MKLNVTDRYLLLPVKKSSETRKLHFYSGGEKFQEVDIKLDGPDCDFYAAMDVGKYIDKEIEIVGEIPDAAKDNICFAGAAPENHYPYRPKLHFTAETGWTNDPNGLIFANGVYHMYYQWNPYGTVWGNMHWGHAVSRDMVTWQHKPMVLDPDIYGTAYSGCAWQDNENAAGFGKGTLLFYYTASGGRNEWSQKAGYKHHQRLAVSEDGGETLYKKGLILDHIAGENRDPKVFYHKESGAYIMLLFLDGYEFMILRSTDLLNWHESSRFTVEKMWECPDLFELNVYNAPGEKRWVFWSADGYYTVGSFDGYSFKPESAASMSYDTKLAYAAQSFAGIKGRTVNVAWLKTKNDAGNFRGMMTIPTELSLIKQNGIYKMSFKPIAELYEHFKSAVVTNSSSFRLNGRPVIVTVRCNNDGVINIGDTCISLAGSYEPYTIIIDCGIVEYFGDNGCIYGSVEAEENVLDKSVFTDGNIDILSAKEMTA